MCVVVLLNVLIQSSISIIHSIICIIQLEKKFADAISKRTLLRNEAYPRALLKKKRTPWASFQGFKVLDCEQSFLFSRIGNYE